MRRFMRKWRAEAEQTTQPQQTYGNSMEVFGMAGAPMFWLSNRDDSGGVNTGTRGEPASMLQQPTPQWPTQQQDPSPQELLHVGTPPTPISPPSQRPTRNPLIMDTPSATHDVVDGAGSRAGGGGNIQMSPSVLWSPPPDWVDINDRVSVRLPYFEFSPWCEEMRTISLELGLANTLIRISDNSSANAVSPRVDNLHIDLATVKLSLRAPSFDSLDSFIDSILSDGFEVYAMANLLNLGASGRSPLPSNNLFGQVVRGNFYVGFGGRIGLNWGVSDNTGFRGAFSLAAKLGGGLAWGQVERCVE